MPWPAWGNSESGGTPTRHSLRDLQRGRSAPSCSITTERFAMRRTAALGFPSPSGRELVRLLRVGAVLGFATGRGKSVKVALREQIPKKYQSQVVVGYYNGGDIARLDDDSRPDGSKRVVDALKPVADAIQSHSMLPRGRRVRTTVAADQGRSLRRAPTEFVWASSTDSLWAEYSRRRSRRFQPLHGRACSGREQARRGQQPDGNPRVSRRFRSLHRRSRPVAGERFLTPESTECVKRR